MLWAMGHGFEVERALVHKMYVTLKQIGAEAAEREGSEGRSGVYTRALTVRRLLLGGGR